MADDPAIRAVAVPVGASPMQERQQQTEAATAGDEWPLLDDYERPITTRLDHLIANTPNIQTIESNDRKAATQQHKQQTADEHDDARTAAPSDSRQQQQGRGAKRSRETNEGGEEKELVPEHVPTYRGGGNGTDVEDEDELAEEERLNRVRPDELYDPQMDERDEQRLQHAHGQRTG